MSLQTSLNHSHTHEMPVEVSSYIQHRGAEVVILDSVYTGVYCKCPTFWVGKNSTSQSAENGEKIQIGRGEKQGKKKEGEEKGGNRKEKRKIKKEWKCLRKQTKIKVYTFLQCIMKGKHTCTVYLQLSK